ncbi:MAG: prepilin-type N-terminal cleavage/methylation domain-containing protein, partial [Chromatiales bacterium]|nr:prepilin-type N-terminal cleavage/methylation domain-containing protein [Chromatiales bacterium]
MLEIGRRNRRRYDGFSLLELLVVLVIISVMTGVALLGWPRSTMPRHLDLRLSDLRTRMDIGADHAVLSGAAVGLQLTPGHYRFVGMTVDGTWRPVGVSLLQGQFVLPGDGVELDVDGRAVRLDGVREKNLVRRPALT